MQKLITGMLALVLAATTACGDDPDSTNNANNNDENNVTPNNVTPNNVTPNNVTPNNVTPNNVTPNNVTPNNVTPNNTPNDEPTIVASFDGASWFLPESLAYHDELAYMSFLNGAVQTVDAAGTVADHGYVPIDPQGSAYALGIAVGNDGTAYVAVVPASATSTFPPGIYSIPPAGGEAALLASHPELYIPNDIDIDAAGNLFITADGRIYRFSGTTPGEAELWAEDAVLASSDGTAAAPCGVRTSPFPIGANGLEVEADRVVIGNTEAGAIISIAILADGSAGAVSTLVANTAELCGIDGFVGDSDGTFLATVLGSRVARISADGSTITALHTGEPLLSPAGVDVGMFGGRHQAIVANPDFHAAFGPDGPPSAQPNLTALPLD